MSKETTITRRAGLALGLSAAALPWLLAEAAPLAYPLAPIEIAPRVWTIYGAPEPITRPTWLPRRPGRTPGRLRGSTPNLWRTSILARPGRR